MKLFILPVKILRLRGVTRHIQYNSADPVLKLSVLLQFSGLLPWRRWELHLEEMEDLGMKLFK